MTNKNRYTVVTYWAPSDETSGFGSPSFVAEPVIMLARWEARQELFKDDTTGREIVSSAIVYPEQDVAVGGFLSNSVSTALDPRTVDTAREIGSKGISDNLRGTRRLFKAWLK